PLEKEPRVQEDNRSPLKKSHWKKRFRGLEYDPEHLGVKFILEGEQREISLLYLRWRVGLYTKRKSRENVTLNGFSRVETVKASHLLKEFWPSIGDGRFNVGNTKVFSIRDPRVNLAQCCIATTISGALSVEPLFDVFKKNSLIAIGVVMELKNGACFWPATREVEEDDEAEEGAEGEAGNEWVGGSADIYRNLSQGDW
ncbi:hypothetical protein Tco_0962858, partial [Tanacetum coccineum]